MSSHLAIYKYFKFVVEIVEIVEWSGTIGQGYGYLANF